MNCRKLVSVYNAKALVKSLAASLVLLACPATAETLTPQDTLTRWHAADTEQRHDDAALIVEEALIEARSAGSLGVEWTPVLVNYATMLSQSMCRYARADALLNEAIDIAEASQDEVALAESYFFRAWHFASYGEMGLARADFDTPSLEADTILGDGFTAFMDSLLSRDPGFGNSVAWDACSAASKQALEARWDGDFAQARRVARASILPNKMDDQRSALVHNLQQFITLAEVAAVTKDIAGLRRVFAEVVSRATEPGAPTGTLRKTIASLSEDDVVFGYFEMLAGYAKIMRIEDRNAATLLRWASASVLSSVGAADLSAATSRLKQAKNAQETIAVAKEILSRTDLDPLIMIDAASRLATAEADIVLEAGDRAGSISRLAERFAQLANETPLPVSKMTTHLAWMASHLALIGGPREAFDAYTVIWKMENAEFRALGGTGIGREIRVVNARQYIDLAIFLGHSVSGQIPETNGSSDCTTFADAQVCTIIFTTP